MNKLDVTFLQKCINALEKAFELYSIVPEDSIEKDIYRSACIKEFEIILEQCAKIIKKILKNYVVSSVEIDRLFFKDVFRKACQFGVLNIEETERWLEYRDKRNLTAHEYGQSFAENIIEVLESFIKDAQSVVTSVNKFNTDAN